MIEFVLLALREHQLSLFVCKSQPQALAYMGYAMEYLLNKGISHSVELNSMVITFGERKSFLAGDQKFEFQPQIRFAVVGKEDEFSHHRYAGAFNDFVALIDSTSMSDDQVKYLKCSAKAIVEGQAVRVIDVACWNQRSWYQ